MGRCLKRPMGGWRAREWRREVLSWLWAAYLFLCAGFTCTMIFKFLDFVTQA